MALIALLCQRTGTGTSQDGRPNCACLRLHYVYKSQVPQLLGLSIANNIYHLFTAVATPKI
jgi:hypothetical protein